jgi:single-strand DNA-binding protein
MNKVILTGRITKDTELKYTSANIEVAQFTLAVTRNNKNAYGNYDTDFINCVAFKGLANAIKNYVKKGDKLLVEGRLQVNSYKDDTGNNKYITQVISDKIEFLELRKKENNNNNTANNNSDKEGLDAFGDAVVLLDDDFLD